MDRKRILDPSKYEDFLDSIDPALSDIEIDNNGWDDSDENRDEIVQVKRILQDNGDTDEACDDNCALGNDEAMDEEVIKEVRVSPSLPVLQPATPLTSPSSPPPKKLKKSRKKSVNKKPQWNFKRINFERPIIPCQLDEVGDNTNLTPYEAFKTLLTDDIFEHIAIETSRYAFQKDGTEIAVDPEDIERYFGVLLTMALVRMPQQWMYWSDQFRYPAVADVMSRNKFLRLHKYFHLANNDDMKKPEEEGYDKLHKVRPLITHLQENLKKLPETEHSAVDEQVIPFKGRSSLKTFNPNKPHKWGIKPYTRAGSNGMMYAFEIYAGSNTCKDYGLGFSGNIVLHLCEGVPNHKNFKLFTDNFFSSIALASALRERGIFFVGTVRKHRVGGAPLKSDNELKKIGRGAWDSVTEMTTGVNFVKWVDKKPITLLSTYASIEPSGTAERWNPELKKKIEIPKPDIVGEYNAFMGGVDLADMLIECYRIDRKCYKLYNRVVYWVIGVSVVNSWLLLRSDYKKSLLHFQQDVISGLLMANKLPSSATKRSRGRPTNSPRDVPARKRIKMPSRDSRFDNLGHFPEYGKESRCADCGKKTHMTCIKCNVHLCLVRGRNCFLNFHKKYQ